MASKEFTSKGFDADALPSSTCENADVVLELGGGASYSNTISNKDSKPSPICKSEESKAEGNARFKVGDFLGAYDSYTDAIEFCPGMKGSELLELKEEFDEEERNRLYEIRRRESERQRHCKKSGENEEQSEEDEAKEEKKDERKEFIPPHHPHANNLSIYHCNRAAACLHLKRYDEAITDCDVALILNPIYTKALIRRMSAFEAVEKTEEALSDAKAALQTSPYDIKIQRHVKRLQKIEDERLEKLKAETMEKLKDMGNSVLGYFGMSLDNFKAEKDPNTGSYNISFQQNPTSNS